jgi:predicted nucleotidyltransferase
MTTDHQNLLRVLHDAEVQFVLIGGVAAILHGSARATFDVDVVYSRTRPNIQKLAACLASYRPYLRGAPLGLPFQFDETVIRNGLNFTLATSVGDLDLLGEVVGGGNYEQLLPKAIDIEAFGFHFKCVSLEQLIQLKRAAGRPKDMESIAELQSLLDERRKKGRGV